MRFADCSAPRSSLRLLSLTLDFTARSRTTFRKFGAYGQVYCPVLHMWMVKVESRREFWKCYANRVLTQSRSFAKK